MAELVAVSTFPMLRPDRSLKREALLFDRLEVFGLSKLLEIAHHWNADDHFVEWRYLRSIGFLRDPRIMFVVPANESQTSKPLPESPLAALAAATPEVVAQIERTSAEMEAICRDYAGRVRADGHEDTVYLGERSVALASQDTAGRDAVLRVVLKHLPLPNESTPWEAIADFRRDPTAIAKYRALRNWMNELGRQEKGATEIEDELLHHMSEYESALALHRIKTTSGVVEALVTSSLDVLGNIASFQWGRAAKMVFDLRKQDMVLREAERGAPGRQIAYLIDATTRFT